MSVMSIFVIPMPCLCSNSSHLCMCNNGYTGNRIDHENNNSMHYCLCYPDIDECASSPCHTNAMCADTNGSFTCTCLGGFSGDGFLCESKQSLIIIMNL